MDFRACCSKGIGALRLGGFTADARLEAETSRKAITRLDRDAFVKLLEHYEALAPAHQSMVPVRKVWVPAI